MELLLACVVGVPFLAAIAAVFVCRFDGKRAGFWLSLAPGLVFMTLLWGLRLDGRTVSWAWLPSLGIDFSLRFDALSLSFGLLISGIGALVTVYSNGYLGASARKGYFFTVLLAFMGAMLGIVFAGDLITLYVFWELTTITSFLLIGFHNEDAKARRNAVQALLVTAGGGLAMLAGIILLGRIAGTYSFDALLGLNALRGAPQSVRSHPMYGPVLALILLGAFTKSAQAPFHFWLPNAMVAPTPVSALLHSATMVKAGVYVLARLHPVLGGTDAWELWVTSVGAVTAVVGAAMALKHSVMKPLLAYTTVSALGLLVACLGLGTETALKAMMAYLFVHAFYKAGLFLVAGTLDHEAGEKDAEKLAGLARVMPLTAAGAALTAWSMAGLPPVLGFVGKELLYESAVTLWEDHGLDVVGAGLAAAFVFANVVNVFAAAQVGWRPFWSRSMKPREHVHEGSIGFWLGPLTLGAIGLIYGVFGGALGHSLVGPAATVIAGKPIEAKLALWHGFTPALALSVVTVIGGVLLFSLRGPLRRGIAHLEWMGRVGPERAYERGFAGLQAVARWQTRVLQNGYLRTYLLCVLMAVLLFPGTLLVLRLDNVAFRVQVPLGALSTALFLAIVGGAITITLTRSRLTALAGLGMVGSGISLLYVLYSAPDLALTQFVVEIFTIMLFLLVVRGLPPFRPYSSTVARLRDATLAVVSGIFFALLVISAQVIEVAPRVSAYYLAHAEPAAHGRNIVNTILVDFRVIDTLGEITVIALGAVGALALLRLRPARWGVK